MAHSSSASNSSSTNKSNHTQQQSRPKKATTTDPLMRNEARKLALFSTRNMKPLLTTDELDPVMGKLGFTTTVTHPTPPSATEINQSTFAGWREYVCNGKWTRVKSLNEPLPPSALIPYPRIDGLDESIYDGFIKSVQFYSPLHNVGDTLHVRGLPLDRVLDRGKVWKSMEETQTLVYVYREVPMLELPNQGSKKLGKGAARRHGEGDDPEAGRMVKLSDIVKR